MRNRIPVVLSRAKKFLLSAAAVASLASPITVGIVCEPAIRAQDTTDWQARAGGKMAFDVASVKVAEPGTFVMPTVLPDNGDAKPSGGHFRANFILAYYISFACKLAADQFQAMYSQLPKWTTNQLYLIEAMADGNPTKDQMRLMMQSLLADRFKLRVHFETKEGPVWALTLVEPGTLGPKLIPHSEGPPCPESFEVELFKPPSQKPDAEWRQCGLSAKVRATSASTGIGARNTTPELIAGDVYAYGARFGELDRPVVDHTGLKGMFDFMLDLPAGIISLIRKPSTPDDPLPEPAGTPFVDAVHKQLG
jgi:bla regulator protein blaR1